MNETGTRERILQAAARLLAESGGGPVSTRAVCAAAGVGAPTLYHHFGDKEGLFDAVVGYGFERYLAEKRAQPATGDPVDDLRRGWDTHVEFGLAHPAFYTLMYGTHRRAAAADEALRILLGITERVARAGRLRVPVKTAARMIHAAGMGVTLSLISGECEDPDLSSRTREAVLAAVTIPGGADVADGGSGGADGRSDDGPSSLSALAIALTSALEGPPPGDLSEAEAALLREWLTRVAIA